MSKVATKLSDNGISTSRSSYTTSSKGLLSSITESYFSSGTADTTVYDDGLLDLDEGIYISLLGITDINTESVSDNEIEEESVFWGSRKEMISIRKSKFHSLIATDIVK